MRGLSTSSLLPAAFAMACATSSPIRQGTGGGGPGGGPSASSSSGVLDATDGGARGCGVGDSVPACNSCIDANCCGPAQFCALDATCLGCLGQPPSQACTLNNLFATFTGCLQTRCAERCGLGGGGGGGSGGSPGASSSTSSSSASSSASSASSSASSSTSSASSTSSSSSGGPLTCAEVDGNVGCCDVAGVLHYCDSTQVEQDQPCQGNTVCGWSYFYGWYDCVSPPGGKDPSGTYPIACGGP